MNQVNTTKQNVANFENSQNAFHSQGSATRLSQSDFKQQGNRVSLHSGEQVNQFQCIRGRPNVSPVSLDIENFKGVNVIQSQSNTQQQDAPFTPPRKHPLISNFTTSGGKNAIKITPTTASSKPFGTNTSGLSQVQQQQPSLFESGQNKSSPPPLNSYNNALDSVAVLGNDFELMIKQLENTSEELKVEKEKNQLLIDQLEQFKLRNTNQDKIEGSNNLEAERLRILLEGANQKLELSIQKNKTLEKKLAESQGGEQKLNYDQQQREYQEERMKLFEREAMIQRDLVEQKEKKIADLEMKRIENNSLTSKIQLFERERAMIQKQLKEKEILNEKLSEINVQNINEIQKLKYQLSEFHLQCDILHDEIDKSIGLNQYSELAKQLFQSNEYLDNYQSQEVDQNPQNKGCIQSKSIYISNQENNDANLQQSFQRALGGGRSIEPQVRRQNDNIDSDLTNQNGTHELLEVPNPLNNSEDDFGRIRRSSSNNRLNEIKEEEKEEEKQPKISQKMTISQMGSHIGSFEQPPDIREYTSTLQFQKDFISDAILNKRRQQQNDYEGSYDEIVLQGLSKIDISDHHNLNSYKIQHKSTKIHTLPLIIKESQDNISFTSNHPPQLDNLDKNSQQNLKVESHFPFGKDSNVSRRYLEESNSQSNQQIFTPNLSAQVNNDTQPIELSKQKISNLENDRVKNNVNIPNNLSVLHLSNSKNVRTVAVGENNMLGKLVFMRLQLQDKNQQLAMLQQKVEAAIQRASEIAIKNQSLEAENQSTKEEVEIILNQYHDESELRRQEIEDLREEWQNQILPLREEKKRLEDLYKSVTEQYQDLKKELQNGGEEKQRIITELIQEKDNLQVFCEELQKQKEYSQLENLKIKESIQDQGRERDELRKIREDQQRQILSQLKDIETWKAKYKSLKKELNGLKGAFEGYKQQILQEVQSSLIEKSSNFRGTINAIRKKYQEQGDSAASSTRDSMHLQPEITRQFIQNEQNYSGNQAYQGGQQKQVQEDIQEQQGRFSQSEKQQIKDEQFLVEIKQRIHALKKVQDDPFNQIQFQQNEEHQNNLQGEFEGNNQPPIRIGRKLNKNEEEKQFSSDEQNKIEMLILQQQQEGEQEAGGMHSEEELAILKQQYENALVRINSVSPQKWK